jgi:hypothetical protein
MIYDQLPVLFRHFQTIHQHERTNIDFQFAASEFKHFGKMSVFEEKSTVQLVVLFIKRAAGYKNSNCHETMIKDSELKIKVARSFRPPKERTGRPRYKLLELNVLQLLISPEFNPFVNQRTRCSELP